MRLSQKLSGFSFAGLGLAFAINPTSVVALADCGEIAGGSHCGHSPDWVTMVWDGGGCYEAEQIDGVIGVCAALACADICSQEQENWNPEMVMDLTGCSGNQWSTWVGFRCPSSA